jgi:RNA binding exosome subunit
VVTGDNQSNTGRDTQTKFEFQNKKYLRFSKQSLGEEEVKDSDK